MLSNYWCQTTMATIQRTPVGTPTAGYKVRANWQGVKHETLINNFLMQCKAKKWKADKPIIDLSVNRKDIAFAIPIDRIIAPGLKAAIAVTATNNGHKTMWVYAGAYCGNGAVVVSALKGPAYTNTLDLSHEVATMTEWADSNFDKVETLRQKLSTHSISDGMIQRDVGWWACREKVIGWPRLGHLDRILKKQSKPTVWDLLVAFGEVIGRGSAQDQCHHMLRVTNFVSVMCGMTESTTLV